MANNGGRSDSEAWEKRTKIEKESYTIEDFSIPKYNTTYEGFVSPRFPHI